MTYTITFFDKAAVQVDDVQAMKIQEATLKGIKHIRIGANLYAASAIARMEKDSISEPDRVGPKYQISSGQPVNPVRKETLERMKREMAEKFSWA